MAGRTDSGRRVRVIRVTQELDLATLPGLRREVEQALAAAPQTLALDLSECAFAGVDAVEELVALTSQARSGGTALILTGMRPIVRRAVRLLGLSGRLLFAEPPRPRSAACG